MKTRDPAPLMHVPPHFEASQARIRTQILAEPFGQLITCDDFGLAATATPFLFESDDPDETRLLGHMASRNPQAATLRDGMPALALFMGPQCYVSPRMFLESAELPTWNYTACQLRGTLTPIDDDAGKCAVLARTAAVMERHPDPWTLAEADMARVTRLLPHIRAFRLTVTRLEGAIRLNQNKPRSERLNILAGLLESGAGDSARVAALMASALRSI